MNKPVQNTEVHLCLVLSRPAYNKLLRHHSGTITALEERFRRLVGINELASVDTGPDFNLKGEFPYPGKIENFMRIILETLLANGCKSADIVIDERPSLRSGAGGNDFQAVRIIVQDVHPDPGHPHPCLQNK